MERSEVALVTGASRGIGRSIAQRLARDGYSVVCVGRDEDALRDVVKGISADGNEARSACGDIGDWSFLENLVAGLERIDLLVNNAGVNYRENMTALDPDHLREIVHTNLSSLVYLTSLVVRRMLGRRAGIIVSISSTIGHRAGPGRSVYAASKHAVEGFSKSIAVELGPSGIRANTIAPTWVETDLAAEVLSDPVKRARIEAELPLGRVLQPEEIGELVAFLASPAAAYLNGASIVADGGLTC